MLFVWLFYFYLQLVSVFQYWLFWVKWLPILLGWIFSKTYDIQNNFKQLKSSLIPLVVTRKGCRWQTLSHKIQQNFFTSIFPQIPLIKTQLLLLFFLTLSLSFLLSSVFLFIFPLCFPLLTDYWWLLSPQHKHTLNFLLKMFFDIPLILLKVI